MNKIYNNLTIDNLMKTEWINQFDVAQKYVINEGLKKNLDVSIYAKSEFNASQMNQIRLGLLNNVDISIYAKPEIDGFDMSRIREKLVLPVIEDGKIKYLKHK